MRSPRRWNAAAVALAAVLALAGAAGAKAPPTGIQVCGANGCGAIAQQEAEQLLASAGGGSLGPAQPAPFYLLEWSWDGAQEPTVAGYWVPQPGYAKLPRGYGLSWSAVDAVAEAALEQAAAGLQPFPAPTPTKAVVGRRAAANPASYGLLLTVGRRVSTWAGAVDWIPVKLTAAQPSPWTDGTLDLRISKASAFVWRDGAVYKIPLELARRARLGRSLTS